jgi:hypothetical protein
MKKEFHVSDFDKAYQLSLDIMDANLSKNPELDTDSAFCEFLFYNLLCSEDKTYFNKYADAIKRGRYNKNKSMSETNLHLMTAYYIGYCFAIVNMSAAAKDEKIFH